MWKGYGQTGPYAKRAGYDVIVEVRTVFYDINVTNLFTNLCDIFWD